MIRLRWSLHLNPRGPGFRKLNTSFLSELEYVNQIKTTIQETYDEYKNDESVHPSLLWEMIKLKIREKSLRYCKNKTKQAKQREIYVEETIQLPDYKSFNIRTVTHHLWDLLTMYQSLRHWLILKKKKERWFFFGHVIDLRIYMVMAFWGTQTKPISLFIKTKEILFCATIFLII